MKLFAAVLTIIAGLLLGTSAKAADRQVPYKVCLTQAQAASIYKGKRLKYREVGAERCWYAGVRLPKHAFIGSRPVERFVGVHGSSNRARPSGVITGLERAGTASSGVDGSNPSRSTINAHPIGIAVSLSRPIQQEAPRVEERSGSIPEVSTVRRTDFTVTLEDDALLALSGRPETDFSFEAFWAERTGWPR